MKETELTDLELMELLAINEARESFWAFRQIMCPDMLVGWWQEEICDVHLQQFYEDMMEGKRPKLLISAPPQHGKSETISYFAAWIAGKQPDRKTIYASFSEDLGERANSDVQRILSDPKYIEIFPETRTAKTTDKNDLVLASLNKSIISFAGRKGSFVNITCGGETTGKGMHLGLLDDPLKGSEAASSAALRDKAWTWLTADFLTRTAKDAGFLCIMTRWHVDDPIGRMIDILGDGIKVVRHEAIASKDELNRRAGEALFPEHKPLETLLDIKSTMSSALWNSTYQQNPQIIGGSLIRGEWFGRYEILPEIEYFLIFGDTASKTGQHNDYSVFQVWGRGTDGKGYLVDQIRGKWESLELRNRLVDFWNKHKKEKRKGNGHLRSIYIEDKSSGTGLIQDIRRIDKLPIKGIQRTKDKIERLRDVSAYIESGYVIIPRNASFVSDFIAECEALTANNSHMHDDQIDPMVDAIRLMVANKERRGFNYSKMSATAKNAVFNWGR